VLEMYKIKRVCVSPEAEVDSNIKKEGKKERKKMKLGRLSVLTCCEGGPIDSADFFLIF